MPRTTTTRPDDQAVDLDLDAQVAELDAARAEVQAQIAARNKAAADAAAARVRALHQARFDGYHADVAAAEQAIADAQQALDEAILADPVIAAYVKLAEASGVKFALTSNALLAAEELGIDPSQTLGFSSNALAPIQQYAGLVSWRVDEASDAARAAVGLAADAELEQAAIGDDMADPAA